MSTQCEMGPRVRKHEQGLLSPANGKVSGLGHVIRYGPTKARKGFGNQTKRQGKQPKVACTLHAVIA